MKDMSLEDFWKLPVDEREKMAKELVDSTPAGMRSELTRSVQITVSPSTRTFIEILSAVTGCKPWQTVFKAVLQLYQRNKKLDPYLATKLIAHDAVKIIMPDDKGA